MISPSPIADWLFLDLNSYFASVEEQERPELRGHPLAVVPVMADTTCCIAANYKAKAFGIRTGTQVREAKALCPGLLLVEARQALYVNYHERIIQAVESCVPVDRVMSIDEMICKLTGSQRQLEEAVALAQRIKRTLFERIGAWVRCSIGLAPNRYLAKVAGDMQKPDGLTILLKEELPQRLHTLALRDLPGIGPRMEARLRSAGVSTMPQLTALTSEELRALWGSVEGERLHAWLRGLQTPEPAHHRRSIGHSHVLAPEFRTRATAYETVKMLTHKAARRLRQEDFWAAGLTLYIAGTDRVNWEGSVHIPETQETPNLLKTLSQLWEHVPQAVKPLLVAVTLHPLIPRRLHTPSLFEDPRRERLASLVDSMNLRFGKDAVYHAALHAGLHKVPTRIAFTRIPDLSEF